MNWKQFKEEVEKQGLRDEDELGYIDVWHFYRLKVFEVFGAAPEPTGKAVEDD